MIFIQTIKQNKNFQLPLLDFSIVRHVQKLDNTIIRQQKRQFHLSPLIYQVQLTL